MTINYTPRTDQKTGANCTGTDASPLNRTYTLAYANPTSAGMQIHLGGAPLSPISDFTYSSGIITFLVPVLNMMELYITYYTFETITTPTSTSLYTNVLQVVRVSGIGVEVFDENVGTGDSSNASFDLDNGNVIDGSYVIHYAASGSNNLSTMTETTHYVLSKDEGRILLTAAGVTALGTNILYASYVYCPKLSNTILETYLLPADKETERKTGNYWGTSTSTTEYFSGNRVKYPDTDEPFATEYNESDYVNLKYKGILTITSVKFITRGSVTPTTETLNSYDYDYDADTGKLVFLNRDIPNGTRSVEVIYTHGYTSVDTQISELAAMFAGLRVFAFISGGSYDDATGYTLGRKQVQIGESWVNIRAVVDIFKNRIESILDDMGRKVFAC